MKGQGNTSAAKGEPEESGAAYRISIAGAGCEFPCRADQSLLAAMVAAGKRALSVGCRSGGCGVCRIQILEGQFRAGFMNRAIVSPANEHSKLVLACRTFPQSDMRIEPKPLDQRTAPFRTDMAA